MKKNIKKLLLLTAVIATLVLCLAVSASALSSSGSCGDDVTYTYNSTTKELVISGTGTMYGYYYYDDSPFYNSDIKSVVIKDGVTSIGNYAFYDCTSLTSITIPDSVTSIGGEAFFNCSSLTSITIPDSVTTIGYRTFYNCTALTSITIPDSVTSIGGFAFYNCSSLKNVYASDIESWLKISFSDYDSNPMCYGANLYFGNELVKEIIIPDGITAIKDYAFYNCTALSSITIPDSVTSIGDEAFYNCESLESVTIGNGVTSIGDLAFSYCTALSSITIPDSVTSIGDYAFRDCTSLTSITIGNGVTSIGGEAFWECSSIKFVYASDIESWLKISFSDYDSNPMCYGANLYFGNELVKEIIIPDGISAIKDYTFRGCRNLESITIPDSVTSIGDEAFYNCESLESVTIGNGVTSIGSSAFSSCTSLKSIIIPDSVTSIDNYAFGSQITFFCNKNSYAEAYAKENDIPYVLINGSDEESIFSGVLGKNFTWILDKRTGVLEIEGSGSMPDFTTSSPAPWASYYPYIKTLTLPSGLKSISNSAFEDFYLLEKLQIPAEVERIGDSAFNGCRSLENVTISNSVTSIGNYAFEDCTSLKSITIPDSVTSIGYEAFYNCSSLKNVYASDIESWLKISFSDDDSNPMCYAENLYFDEVLAEDIVIPAEVKEIKSYAFYDCDSLKSVTISEGVERIGNYAFADCKKLEKVEIPSTADFGSGSFSYYYHNGIFSGCSALKTVIFNLNENYESKISLIPENTFSGCSALKEIVLPASVKTIESNSFPTTLEKITIYNPECDIDLNCGITYNTEIIGFKDSTAEAFADEKAAFFTDVETVHTHAYKTVSDTQATCLESGLFLERCLCGKENKEVRPATGHDFKDFEITLEPTCTTRGQKKAFCKNCDYFEMQYIAATNHPKKENRAQQNATCTEYGYTSGVYCPDCDSWLSGHVRIEKTGHIFTEKILDAAHLVSDATATSAAIYKYDCANCDTIGEATFTHGEPTGLGKTGNITAAQNTSAIKLTWEAVEGATGYIIFAWFDTSWEAVAFAGGTTYTFTNLPAGTKYKLAVLAYGTGNGFIKLAKDYTTIETATKALKPSNVRAAQNTSTIRLTWNAVDGADGYRIYYKSGSSWKVCVNSTTATTYTFTKLNAGAKFTFAIRPYVLGGGNVIWSDYTQFTAATTPAAVTTKASSTASGKVAMTWNAVNGADGYQVYYKVVNGSYKLYKTYTSVQTLTFSGLASGTKYTFAVRAGIKTSSGNIFGSYKAATVTVR